MARTTESDKRDVTLWAIIVLIVLVVAAGVLFSFFIARSYKIEKAAKDSTAASVQAGTSAEAARQALQAAIDQGKNSPAAQATSDAIAAIHRIETRLCGGPCPG